MVRVYHPEMDESWDDWRVVHVAWQTGSFTAAAQALGIGQATVSRRVARVEDKLGHTLFDRHRTGLVPTDAARALRPHLEALVAAADDVDRALDGLETEASGVVRLAAPPGVCVDMAPRLAVRLAHTHPGVRLEVLADVDAADLDRREADLALRFMSTTRGDLLVRRVALVQACLVAAPSLVAELADVALSEVPLVQWSSDRAHIPMARFLASLGGPVTFTANDYLVLREAVRAGLGACVFSELEARMLGLVPVPVPLELPSMPLYLVVHRALRRVPRVAAVVDAIDFVVAELGV